jgi:ABC-type bacteriocin/lantibiotic exporter with double-glycine peptidase domain
MSRLLPQRLGVLLVLCGIVFAGSNGIWLDVPFVKQQKDGCGSAVISMVMQYWSGQQSLPADPASAPDTIQKTLFSSNAHGIYASDLKRYLEQHGFAVFEFRGAWDDLAQHLSKGRPLIAALKPITGETALHYVVVAGIDPAEHAVILNDPAQRKLLKVDRTDFEQQWKATKNWTLLAVPKSPVSPN